MTIPEWSDVKQVSVFRREQDQKPLPQSNAPKNLHVLVRGTVLLPKGKYVLRVSADDCYQAWLDGIFLGSGPAPGYPQRYFYQEYPITGGGKRVIALHLYYQGLINRVWNSGDGRFGVWAEIVQGDNILSRCDERWKYQICSAYSGDVVGYETQFLENFDSRKYPEHWEKPAYSDRDWPHLVRAGYADYRLERQPTQNLDWQSRTANRTSVIPRGTLLDFGKEITGVLSIKAMGRDGQKVRILYGEELDGAGEVRYELRCNCRYEETWTLKNGISTFHGYDYKAFRYVQLEFEPDVTIMECRARVRHYPMDEEACRLKCKTDQLDEIFEICKNAVRCGTQESFLDCPSREKGQYLGDAILTARSHVWLTGKTGMLRKCIGDFIASARISKGLMAVAPGSLMQEIADFSLLFPMLPLTDYAFTGDRAFLRECYPTVRAMTEAFGKYARRDGLLENVSEQWNLVDWPENLRDGYDFPLTRPIVGQGCHNVVNALWYGAWVMREKMESILALPSEGRSEQLKEAFRNAFYREERHLFADSEVSDHCSLHANLYAAYFGLLPPKDVDDFEKLMLTPDRCCGVFPMYFALKALARGGKHDAFYRLLTRDDAYGWRNMLREGATACFETWGKDQKWNTSLCHPWASSPISLIIEDIAGVKPTAGKFRFSPNIPECISDFDLTLPLQGERYRITLINNELKMKRMESNADTANE